MLRYYIRLAKTIVRVSWDAYNISLALMTIVVPLILVPFFKRYDLAGSRVHMNDLIWQIPLAILTLFLAARSILTPFLLDQEREKEIQSLTNTHRHTEDDSRERINKLEKALTSHTLQYSHRVALASLHDEGSQLRQTYLAPGVLPRVLLNSSVSLNNRKIYEHQKVGRLSSDSTVGDTICHST